MLMVQIVDLAIKIIQGVICVRIQPGALLVRMGIIWTKQWQHQDFVNLAFLK